MRNNKIDNLYDNFATNNRTKMSVKKKLNFISQSKRKAVRVDITKEQGQSNQ